jgi:hypothetical protein
LKSSLLDNFRYWVHYSIEDFKYSQTLIRPLR